jgi:hypothetical protein
MSFKLHRESHTIENIAKTIGQDLERITDEIQRNAAAIRLHEEQSEGEGDEMYDLKENLSAMKIKVNGMVKQLALLQKQTLHNSKIIEELMKKRAPPVPTKDLPSLLSPPPIKRVESRYQPQHPLFKLAGAQSAARKTYCWLTQSSNDKKNKAKQDKLVQEYYADKTTDARREKIIKELMAMAKCKDKCKLQGKTLISAKGCGDDASVRKFVMDKLESSTFANDRRGTATVLTKRRPRSKTALKSPGGYDAKSFRA